MRNIGMNILKNSKYKLIILLLILAGIGLFVFVGVKILMDIRDPYKDVLDGYREYATYIINDDVSTAWENDVF